MFEFQWNTLRYIDKSMTLERKGTDILHWTLHQIIDSCEVTNLSFPKFSDLAESRPWVASDRGWLLRATSWLGLEKDIAFRDLNVCFRVNGSLDQNKLHDLGYRPWPPHEITGQCHCLLIGVQQHGSPWCDSSCACGKGCWIEMDD